MANVIFVMVIIFFVGTSLLRVVCNHKSKSVVRINNDELEKGQAFEEEVASFLNACPNVKVLRNLIIPNGRKGGTTEIDLVVLSTKGFYVLECKNYSGYVVGKPEEKNWTICYNYNGYKKNVSFYNPLKQNIGHITALKKMYPRFHWQSTVLFSNSTAIEKDLFVRKDVMNFSGFKKYFLDFFPKRKESETQAVVDSIYDYLKSYENKDRDSHIRYVNSFKNTETA